jgi:hypothetical protein
LYFIVPKGSNLVALSQPKVYFKIPPQRIERMYEQYPQQKPLIEKALKKLWASFKPFMSSQTEAEGGEVSGSMTKHSRNPRQSLSNHCSIRRAASPNSTDSDEVMTDQTITFENQKDIDFLYLLASFRSGALQFSTLSFREGELSPALFEMCLLKEL